MSDVFIIPVDSIAMAIRDDQIYEYYNDGVTPWDLIDKAINNHDRLEAENARLREFVKKVAELDTEIFRFETQDGDYDFIEYICTDILDDANELLEELEKTNE